VDGGKWWGKFRSKRLRIAWDLPETAPMHKSQIKGKGDRSKRGRLSREKGAAKKFEPRRGSKTLEKR